MYLRNSCYVVAWSHDLATPQSITVMDEALVVWRLGDGGVAVLSDRCPHRQLPLSMGSVDGRYCPLWLHRPEIRCRRPLRRGTEPGDD